MSQYRITESLLSVIHDARARIGNKELSEAEETDEILNRLLGIESYLDCYEEIDVIRRLKELVSSYVSSDECSAAPGEKNSISVHRLRNGLGPVRRTFMAELSDHLSCVTQEQILTNTRIDNTSCTAQKKQKSGSLFDSFNFDDLGTLEPLEMTLDLLRKDCCSDLALSKLMNMDVGELIEHPQWFELLSLLWKSLRAESAKEQAVLPSRAVHVRLMHTMSGQQSLDAAKNLFKLYWQRWGAPWWAEPRCAELASPTPEISRGVRGDVATLYSAMRCCEKHLEASTEAGVEDLLVLLFLLLAVGRVPLEGGAHMPVLDVLCLMSSRDGRTPHSTIPGIMRSFNNVTALSYSLSSSLLACLVDRLNASAGLLASLETGAGEEHGARLAWVQCRFVLDASLFVALVQPGLVEASSRDLVAALVSLGRQREYLWDGAVHEGGEVINVHSNAVSNDGMPKVYTLDGTNKYFRQLSGSLPLLEVIQGERTSPSSSLAHDIDVLSEKLAAGVRVCTKNMHEQDLGRSIAALYHCQHFVRQWKCISSPPQRHQPQSQSQLESEACEEDSWTVTDTLLARCPDDSAVILHYFLREVETMVTSSASPSAETQATRLMLALCASPAMVSLIDDTALRGKQEEQIGKKHIVSRVYSLMDSILASPFVISNSDPAMTSSIADVLPRLVQAAVGSEGGPGVAALLFLTRVVLLPPALKAKLSTTTIEAAMKALLDGFVQTCSQEKGNDFVLRRLSCSVLQLATSMSSTLLLQPSCRSTLVTVLAEEASKVDVWELESTSRGAKPSVRKTLSLCASLGCGDSVLSLLREAWLPLDRLCTHLSINSLASLLGALIQGELVSLQCEPFFHSTLAIAGAASCHVLTVALVHSLRGDYAGDLGQEEEEDAAGGVDAGSLFRAALATRCQPASWAHGPAGLPPYQIDTERQLFPHVGSSVATSPPGSNETTLCAGIRTTSTVHAAAEVVKSFLASAPAPPEGESFPRVGVPLASFILGIAQACGVLPLEMEDLDTSNKVASLSALQGGPLPVYAALVGLLVPEAETTLSQWCSSISPSGILEAAYELLATRDKQHVLTVLSNTGMSADPLCALILGNWFLPFLSLPDALLVAAATIVGGNGAAARVLAAILEVLANDATQGGIEVLVPGAFTNENVKFRILDNMM